MTKKWDGKKFVDSRPLKELQDMTFTAKYDPVDFATLEGKFCIVCGRDGKKYNISDVFYFDGNGFICSRMCAQDSLDKYGATLHYSDGTKRVIEPGTIKLDKDEIKIRDTAIEGIWEKSVTPPSRKDLE